MIVLIDSGNSRLKLRAFNPREVARDNSTAVLEKHDFAGLQDWLRQSGQPLAGALGVNVAGSAQGSTIDAALRAAGCPGVRWLRSPRSTLGLINGYTTPENLGADRWYSLVGAQAVATPGVPFLLATFGTATTIDTVGQDGVFTGGLILPGPALMRQSLASGTANLPLAEDQPVDFPTNTGQAIATGVAAAQAGALLRQWLTAYARYGQAPRLFVAGGGWPDIAGEAQRLLAEDCVARKRVAPRIIPITHPVLDGLARIATNTESPTP